MSEKTEKATPYQLQKAKERGQVSKSVELNTCIALGVFLTVATVLWPACLLQLKAVSRYLLNMSPHFALNIANIHQLQCNLLTQFTTLWLPFAWAGLLSIIASTIAQTGLVWSFKPLVPDFKRLDAVRGFKRLGSSKLWFDAGKNGIKLALAMLLLGLSFRHELPTYIHFMTTAPAHYPVMLMSVLSKILVQLITFLLGISIIDTLYTRWKFAKDNRMSKQELKDEYRQREGDPKIKAKIKQLQHQQRQKTHSLDHIKIADVVIRDGHLLAIALKYERGQMPAPKVVCKAQGKLVVDVTLLATQHHIPIIENKPLAQLLFATVGLNQWIKRTHFPKVALIFRDLYRQKASR